MSTEAAVSSDVAFSPSVKAVQSRRGSREGYASMERRGGWRTTITPDLAAFIGGPAGFLHVLDERTIAFADFSGNRQYISTGNLADNPKAHLFLIDYMNRRRVKIWGEARVVEDDPALLERLMPEGYKARGEQVI